MKMIALMMMTSTVGKRMKKRKALVMATTIINTTMRITYMHEQASLRNRYAMQQQQQPW